MKVVKDPSEPIVPCVLYVDPDTANREAFQAAFQREFKVLLALGLEDAWKHLAQHDVHVVICDQRLPGIDGSMALREIRSRYPQVRRMLVSAQADLQSLVDALNHGGACFYIQEPWEVEVVRAAVAQAFAEIRQEWERRAYTERLLDANRQLEFALRQTLLA
ncbi:MAG TPA: response regulator [Flavobacteriales bacterium]|jgi:DNA-binding NtrC family response regulator|nr:response regulator [Flavobacteriales bacterium]